ncbi:MAG: hypothetical protein IKP50_00115 [Bacilli bacterium]|nr:hypothetical protein [Bacilli bacterium]
MVQEQLLNLVLAKKDFSILVDNNIDENYFPEYIDEYNFIKDHVNEYKVVPDIESFCSKFTSFDVLDVTESERYLVNTIREEYLYSKSVPVIKRAAELLKTDANAASQYLQSELVNLTPNYSTPSVDIIHDNSRMNLFSEKAQNKDKYFIPTGFKELDDVVCGWQQGEEYVVIYARTGNGKSWVLVKSMQHAWLMGKNVGYISPEMSADKIGYRFDTLYKHFSNTALTRGNQSVVTLDDYNSYFEELSKQSNKFLVATPLDFNKKITISKLRTWVTKNKLDVLAIDGITYLSDERYKKGDNKTISLTNLSEDLIQLSVELKIPILVVVQSNRGGVKEEADATPELEDIRDSDGIAHNATKSISLKKKDDSLIMSIKKNRDGVMGTKLKYQWDADTGDFQYIPDNDIDRPQRTASKPQKQEGKVAF